MPSPADAFQAFRRLGLRPSLHYVAYQAQLRSGWFRLRTPGRAWLEGDGYRATAAPAERFPMPGGLDLRPALSALPESSRDQAVDAAEAMLRGQFDAFGRQVVDAGFPPEWSGFLPLVDEPPPVAAGLHWSAYHLDSLPGDVKLVWELSRFGWVYTLGRAWAFTEDDRFADAFWALLSSWRQANPPNIGPQWISGQEVALRLMALIYAWRAFDSWLSADDTRRAVLLEMVDVHARRLPPTLDYALAQDNNHLLVEAAALMGAGSAFPDLPRAKSWQAAGRKLLVQAVPRQFFEDGGYVQHSVNYARLAIQTVLWAAVVADRAGRQLPSPILKALSGGCDWLEAMMIGGSGTAPNLGPNDGALILPLSACDFADLRPTIDAVRRFAGRTSIGAGPWNELGDWLGLPKPSGGPAIDGEGTAPMSFPQAGTYRLGRGRLRAVLRCAHYERRPGHADQLHLDVWYDGQNLALDPGTYLYSGSPPWDNGLAGSDVHNLPTLDRQPIMRRVGRFLWLDWAQGSMLLRRVSPGGGIGVLAASHDGYRKLGMGLQRTVFRLGDGALLVVDEAFGSGRHRMEVGWNLPDAGWTSDGRAMQLAEADWTCRVDLPDTPARLTVFRAGEQIIGPPAAAHPTWGWVSPTYALRSACLRTQSVLEGDLPLRMITWFEWDTGTRGRVDLTWRQPEAGHAPLDRISLDGEELQF